MKYDLEQVMTSLDGTPMAVSDKVREPWTVRAALANALLTDIEPSPGVAGNKESKMERYDLYVRIKTLKQSELTSGDLSIIRRAVLDTYTTFFAGQLVYFLDQRLDVTPA